MTDRLYDRLTPLRVTEDDPDWHDVLRRTARRRTRRLSAQAALLVLCAALMATPALGLGGLLSGGQDDAATTPPMWLGLNADGTFCIALATNRATTSTGIAASSSGSWTPSLHSFGAMRTRRRAPRSSSCPADGRSTPVPTRWLEAPGAVHVFAEPLAAVATTSLARSAGPGRSTARARGPAPARRLTRPAVRDRRAPVAPERLRPQLDAGRRLPALVLRAVDQSHRPLDELAVEPVGGQLLARPVVLDVGLQDAVELGVRRERVLVELVGAQLGGRRVAR